MTELSAANSPASSPQEKASNFPPRRTLALNSLRAQTWVFALGPAILSLTFALSTLIGWHLTNVFLVHLDPQWPPMLYSTAVALLFASVGSISAARNYRTIALVTGLLVVLIGLLDLVGDMSRGGFSIDRELLGWTDTPTGSAFQPAPLNETLGLLLIGLTLLLKVATDIKGRSLVLVVLGGSLVLAIGSEALVELIRCLDNPTNWSERASMSMHSTVSFMLLGVSLLQLGVSNTANDSYKTKRMLAIPLAIGGLAFSLMLAQALREDDERRINRELTRELANTSIGIQTAVKTAVVAVERMADRWELSNRTTKRDWEADAMNYLYHQRAYRLLAWVDSDGKPQYLATRDSASNSGKSALISTQVQSAIMLNARTRLLPLIGNPYYDDSKVALVSIYIPLLRGSGLDDGVLVVVLEIENLLESLSQRHNAAGYAGRITDGDRVILSYGDNPVAPTDHLRSQEFDHYGRSWQLSIWPSERLEQDMHSTLPWMVLGIGTLLSLLLFLLYLLRLAAIQRAQLAEAARAPLEQEITRRLDAESTLQKYAERLRRSNRELQEFAFVASHDLQEPLRKVQAFGERLEQKCGDQLGDRGLDYLKRMRNAASRMQQLIMNLLALSRISTQAQPFESVDLNEILREVGSDISVRVEELKARLEVSPLPTIDADANQMRQLFLNLIGNALKYHRPGVPPVVTVTAMKSSSKQLEASGLGAPAYTFTVQDNGIGFEPGYADRIFGIFQRLHGRDEYEGTGIGLSICQRIVERHGGNIRAQSDAVTGATFTIILPAHHHDGTDPSSPTTKEELP